MITPAIVSIRKAILELQQAERALVSAEAGNPTTQSAIPTPRALDNLSDDSVWEVTAGKVVLSARLSYRNLAVEQTERTTIVFPRIDTLVQDNTSSPAEFLQQCATAIASRMSEGYVLEDLEIHMGSDSVVLGVAKRPAVPTTTPE